MYFHMLPSLTFTLHVVMVTNPRHFVYLMDVNVHVKFQLDTTTRTYFLGGGGAQCAPPPWFLEHQKSLVWIGLIHGRLLLIDASLCVCQAWFSAKCSVGEL